MPRLYTKAALEVKPKIILLFLPFPLDLPKRLSYNITMEQAMETKPTMTCPACQGTCKRFAVNRNGSLRFRCPDCKRTFTEEQPKPFGKMTTPVNEALIALGMLLEGASVRSTERLTGMHRDTILRLLVAAGEKCEKLMGRLLLVNIPVSDLQLDEIWSYVGIKEGHKTPAQKDDEGTGDVYTFVAIERHHKLVVNFTMGKRNQQTTDTFIEGVRHAHQSLWPTRGWRAPVQPRRSRQFGEGPSHGKS